MKRSYRGVILLSVVLFLNIVCTQYVVNHYFHEKYELVLVFALLNVLLFPLALWIYKKEVRR
ncbi:hypothetical protein SAMN04487969_104256 [Paenibacillus algorifonticola]|uniref:Uncharacterized protein n=1 Tax=Paenibacillus algorifonticola TaxID=684063 RepID=A0A1I2C434_9BACL|nr:hypothetical protein [Paenibacillus algorifonticola]SFE62958.1 hypothetical protein SAMN04487969_104256 [Paenibacillus algorifonticola]